MNAKLLPHFQSAIPGTPLYLNFNFLFIKRLQQHPQLQKPPAAKPQHSESRKTTWHSVSWSPTCSLRSPVANRPATTRQVHHQILQRKLKVVKSHDNAFFHQNLHQSSQKLVYTFISLRSYTHDPRFHPHFLQLLVNSIIPSSEKN